MYGPKTSSLEDSPYYITPNKIPDEEQSVGIGDQLKGLVALGKNIISRNLINEEQPVVQNIEPKKEDYVGNPIRYGKSFSSDFYYAPESIDLKSKSFGYRNRGDYTPVNTEGLVLTSMYKFQPFGKQLIIRNKNTAYIGIDASGKLKIGDISDFKSGDYLAPITYIDTKGFQRDQTGNYKVSQARDNRGYNSPINYNGDTKAFNILLNKTGDFANQYGSVTGGRFIIQSGDELRLVSGSLNNINSEIESLKNRTNNDTVRVYQLDNGTYNRGLRSRNKKINSQDWIYYDNLNVAGGNGLYIK